MASCRPDAEAPVAPLTSNPSELLRIYLRAREEGRAPDLEDFCSQAGAGAEELRRRIALYESLHEVSLAITRESERGPRPQPVPPETSLGRYRIQRLIEEGGMSRVYLAHDPELERLVALKVIENVGLVSSRAREWMLNEARSLARLDHPGIVRVLDVESDGVHDFIVMEHVPGPSLTHVIAEMRRRKQGGTTKHASTLPSFEIGRHADALETFTARAVLVKQLADALAWCHDRGVLHRDIKPANILIDQRGEPRLIDFGLAHIDQEMSAVGTTDKLVGTAEYVAPEQVDAERSGADPASDQYSLGVVLFELLTLKSPFQRRTRALTLDAVSRAAPRRPRQEEPSVPRDLETICLHAIERKPEHRYPRVDGLVQDLQAWLEHRPLSVSSSPLQVLGLWVRRNRTRVAIGALGLALLIGAVGTERGLRYRATVDGITDLLRDTRVEELTEPEQFARAFGKLFVLELEAGRFDEGWLRTLVFGEQTKRVTNHGAALSEQLSIVLRDLEDARSGARLEEAMVRWMPALRQEEELCPESAYNLANRARGRVDLGQFSLDQVELFGYEPRDLPGFRASWYEVVPIPFSEHLTRGTYLLLGPPTQAGQPRLQTSMVVGSEAHAPIHVTFDAPRSEFAAGLLRLPRPELSLFGERLRVRPFAVMPAPVTWGQFLPFAIERWGKAEVAALFGGLPPEEPARVNWIEAYEFARWAGMRLPTALEFACAAPLEGFQRAQQPVGTTATPGVQYKGEWVIDPDYEASRERLELKYAYFDQEPVPRSWTSNHQSQLAVTNGPSSPEPGRRRSTSIVGFRLALDL